MQKTLISILSIIAVIAIIGLGIMTYKYNVLNKKNISETNTNQSNNEQNIPKEVSSNNLKTYNADGFSFQYDSSALVKVESYGSGALFYDVYKVEGVGEQIRLHTEKIDSFESFCGKNIETHQIVIAEKKFTYCDSKADPSRTYFYIKNGKTLVIITSGSNGKPYSYIVPESVNID
jgi:uncharacterized protein YxeA